MADSWGGTDGGGAGYVLKIAYGPPGGDHVDPPIPPDPPPPTPPDPPDFGLDAVTYERLLADLPPVARTDRIVKATLRAQAVELQRLNNALTAMCNNMFVRTADTSGLPLWEASIGLPVNPALPVATRQAVCAAHLQRAMADGAGSAWESVVQALLDSAWSYRTHDEQDNTSPPFDHIEIVLPYSDSAPQAAAVRRLLQAITPATVVLTVSYDGGFVLDRSQLDASTL